MAVSHATRKVSPNTYIHAQKTAHEGCFCVSRVYTLKIWRILRVKDTHFICLCKYTTNEQDK